MPAAVSFAAGLGRYCGYCRPFVRIFEKAGYPTPRNHQTGRQNLTFRRRFVQRPLCLAADGAHDKPGQ